MRKSYKVFLKGMFLLLLMCMLMPAMSSQAATAKQKALKAYKKFLTKTYVNYDINYDVKIKNCKFALAYMDNDSIPELILTDLDGACHMGGYGILYTYRNVKVTKVTRLTMDGTFYYYKKKGIYIDRYMGYGYKSEIYVKLSKGKITELLNKSGQMNDKGTIINADYGLIKSDMSFQTISKSSFSRRLKKLVGSTQKSTLKFYKNTKTNRNKVL